MTAYFYVNSSSTDNPLLSEFPVPKYVAPSLLSTAYTINTSTTTTYLHPFYIPKGLGSYEIFSIYLPSVRQVSGTRNLKAVIYQMSTLDNYTLSLVRAGNSTTTLSSTSFGALTLSLQNINGDPVILDDSQQTNGSQYWIGFQTTSASGNMEIKLIDDGSISSTEDQWIDTFSVASVASSIGTQEPDVNPGGIPFLPISSGSSDFAMALIGNGPPPPVTYTTITKGDKSITWNFSVPSGYTEPYSLRYLVNTSSSSTKPFANLTGSSPTSFSGTNLTPGTNYRGHAYLERTYGETVSLSGTSRIVTSTAQLAQGIPTINSVSVTQGSTNTTKNEFTVVVSFTNNSSNVTLVRVTPSGETAVSATGSNLTSPQTFNITTEWNKTVTFTVEVTNSIGTATTSTGSYTVPVQPQVPNAVTTISAVATAFTPTQTIINWSNPGVPSGTDAITSYKVQRALATKTWNGSQWTFAASGSYSTIATVGNTTLTYTDNSCSAYTAYMYRVIAVNSVGDSTGNTAVGVLTDGGRIYIATTGGSWSVTPRYIEDPVSGLKLRTYRYTGSGEGGWEPTPY